MGPVGPHAARAARAARVVGGPNRAGPAARRQPAAAVAAGAAAGAAAEVAAGPAAGVAVGFAARAVVGPVGVAKRATISSLIRRPTLRPRSAPETSSSPS